MREFKEENQMMGADVFLLALVAADVLPEGNCLIEPFPGDELEFIDDRALREFTD